MFRQRIYKNKAQPNKKEQNIWSNRKAAKNQELQTQIQQNVPLFYQIQGYQYQQEQLNNESDQEQVFENNKEKRRQKASDFYYHTSEDLHSSSYFEENMQDTHTKDQNHKKQLQSYNKLFSKRSQIKTTEANKKLFSNPENFYLTNLQKESKYQRQSDNQNQQICKQCCLHSLPAQDYTYSAQQEQQYKNQVIVPCKQCQIINAQRDSLKQVVNKRDPQIEELGNIAETNQELYEYFSKDMQDKISQVKCILKMYKLPKQCCKAFGRCEHSVVSSIPNKTQKRLYNKNALQNSDDEVKFSNRSYQNTKRKDYPYSDEQQYDANQYSLIDESTLKQIQKATQNLKSVSGGMSSYRNIKSSQVTKTRTFIDQKRAGKLVDQR